VPLAPGEVYYGRGYYGRGSVNITQASGAGINLSATFYRNVNARNGVAFVARDAFASGRISYVRPSERLDVVLRQRVAPVPNFRPRGVEGRMPVIRAVTRGAAPPPAVAQRSVRDLKERFPRLQGARQAAPAPSGAQDKGWKPPRSEDGAANAPGRPQQERREGGKRDRQGIERQGTPPAQPSPQATAVPQAQEKQPKLKPRRVWNMRGQEDKPEQPEVKPRPAAPAVPAVPAGAGRRNEQRPVERQDRQERKERPELNRDR
jgi:hypothetical protein